MVIRLERPPTRRKRPANIAIDYRETAPAAATREMFLDEKGNADPRKLARFRACDRRARHRGGTGTGAPALRLRPPDAGGADRAGHCARARRFRGRGRYRGLAAARAHAAGALAVVGEDLPQGRRQCAGAGRHARAARPRRHAGGDRAARAARVLRGPDRREARRRGTGRRRHHDRGRSQELSPACPPAGARPLSRARDHLDAAVVVRRRGADRDAQRARRLQAQRAGRRRASAPDDRGDAARLCRPRRLSRRSGGGERAAVAADVETLCRAAPRRHQPRTRHAVARDP